MNAPAPTRATLRALAAGALLLLFAASLGHRAGAAQETPGSQPHLSAELPHASDDIEPLGSVDLAEHQRLLIRLNRDRQRQIVEDTQKLVELSTKYHDELMRDNPDHLTPAQIRRLSEMEKLAKSIKDRMTTAIGDEPVFFHPAPFPIFP